MKTTINLCLNDFISRYFLLSEVVEKKSQISYITFLLDVNRGKNNRRTFIRTAERWPRPLNRGGRFKGILCTVYYTDNSFWTLR